MKYNNLLLSRILKSKRILRGISIRNLAGQVGISDTELSRIENGERLSFNIVTLIKICDVLKLNFVKLLQYTNYLPSRFDDTLDSDFSNIPQFVRVNTNQRSLSKCQNCPYYGCILNFYSWRYR